MLFGFLDRAVGRWRLPFRFVYLLRSRAVKGQTIVDGRPCFYTLWSRAIGGRTIVGQNHRESDYCGSNYYWLSRQRCSIDEKRSRYGPWVSDHLPGHLWLSFLRTVSGPRWNSPSDESCTHIQPFIKTMRPSRWINLELRLDLQPPGFVNELSSR